MIIEKVVIMMTIINQKYFIIHNHYRFMAVLVFLEVVLIITLLIQVVVAYLIPKFRVEVLIFILKILVVILVTIREFLEMVLITVVLIDNFSL